MSSAEGTQENLRDQTRKKAEELAAQGQQATERLREKGEETRQALSDAANEIHDQIVPVIESLDETTRKLVSEHPIATLVGAVAAGYLVGRLLSRR